MVASLGRPAPIAAQPTLRSVARIALAGISHETNTFNPRPTTLDDFRQRTHLTGSALIHQARGSQSALGGVIGAADDAGAGIMPGLFASATPGGVITAETFATLRQQLVDRLAVPQRGPWPVAGAVLVQHGAMVAAGEPDADAVVVEAVRVALGPGIPIVVVLDFHANLSPRLAVAADLILAYDTYPHLDTVERGREAVAHLLSIRTGTVRPTWALRQVPLLAPLPAQRTTGATVMAELHRMALDAELQPGVIAVTITGGFPYADVVHAGMAVLVTTNDDAALAEAIADQIAATAWDQRERLCADTITPAAALEQAARIVHAGVPGPVVLADTGDNPGAGGTGDSTVLLNALLDRAQALGLTGAAVAAIADPAAVAAAITAGVGATLRIAVGGHHDPASTPVERAWQIRAITDGRFANCGPMGTGSTTRLGRTVVLHTDGVDCVVCEQRTQALDPEIFRAAGIDALQRPLLVVKSSVHYRAAFEPIAAAVYDVDTDGLSRSNLVNLPYRYVRRPIAPLDREVRYGKTDA